MNDEQHISDEWDPSSDEVNVIQIVSAATQTEIVVPLDWPNPEATLLDAAGVYLQSLGIRVPLLAFTTQYIDEPQAFLVGTLFTGPEVGIDGSGPLHAMDQKDK